MKKLITSLMIVAGLLFSFALTSCGKDEPDRPEPNEPDEPGVYWVNDYYFAYEPAGEYYWIIDLDEKNPNLQQYDNTFTIRAWSKTGKIIQSMNSYAGNYSVGTGSHEGELFISYSKPYQSMTTRWYIYDNELRMSSTANPEELRDYVFYHGVPSFEK